MATSMADLGFNIDSSPMRRATGEMDRMSKASGRAEKSVTGFTGATNLARAAVAAFGAAVGGMTFGRIITETANFEQGMRNVAAVSGATAAQLDSLTESALEAAATTRFNPRQTTEALYSLASSGQSASEQMASLINVLNLAEAGQSDLGSATELTTSTLNQFGLSADESARVADVFVASIGASALNVGRLQVSMRNAGPTAAALGQSLEGTTSVLGMLTTAFGNGERAGTGFRAILNELPDKADELGVSIRNANGQFRPMVDILADLEANGVTANQVVSAFGAEAGPALAALLKNGSDALRTMEGRLSSTGQAADTAAKQLDTLRGDMDALASSVSVAMIEIGDSQSGLFRDTTQTVTDLVRIWSGYGDSVDEGADATRALASSLEALAALGAGVVVARLGGAVATTAATMAAAQLQALRYQTATAALAGTSRAAAVAQASLAGAVRGASGAMALLGGPAGLAILAGGALYYFREELGLTSPAAMTTAEAIDNVTDAMRGMNREQQVGFLEDMQRNFAEAQSEVERLTAKLEKIDVPGNRGGRAGNIIGAIKRDLAEAKQEVEVFGAQVSTAESELAKFDRSREGAGQGVRTLSDGMGSAAEAASAYKDELGGLQDRLNKIRNEVNPIGAEFARVGEQIRTVQEAMLSGDTDLAEGEGERLIKSLVEQMAEGGEDAGKAFSDGMKDGFSEVGSAVDSFAGSMQKTLGIVRDMTKEGSDGYQELTVAINALNAMQAINAVLNQASGNPYTAFGRMAAMAGAVASLGYSIGGLTGGSRDISAERQETQGTGTVLGDATAKTESIANATDLIADTNEQLVNINTGMLRALQAVQTGITGAAGLVARGREGAQFGGMPEPSNLLQRYSDEAHLLGQMSGGFNIIGEIEGLIDDVLGFSLGGLLDGIHESVVSTVIGGGQSVNDEGVRIIGGTIGEMLNDTMAQAYRVIKTEGGWFSSDDYDTQTQALNSDLRQQFALTFEALSDSVIAGAETLGINAEEAVRNFEVATQSLSLKGMGADEQREAIEDYFSVIFDNLANTAIPFIDELQRAGEGMGETLARVATQVQVMAEAVISLGLHTQDVSARVRAFAARDLVELMGGLENFTSALTGFESNFLSEAQQFENNARRLTEAMADLPLPETRDGFAALVSIQDRYTQSGRENIATLLQLQDVADEYYSALEDRANEQLDSAMSALQRSVQAEKDAAREQYNARIEANQLATDAAREGLQAIQREVQGLEQALGSLRGAFDPLQEVRRSQAMDTLRSALSSGDLTGAGEAAGIASQIDSAGFATRADYQRAQGQTLGLLEDLEDVGDDQLTTAERAIQALERQREDIQVQHDAEMARLDGIIERFQLQIDRINGVDNSVLSVRNAVNQMSAAVVSALSMLDAAGSSGADAVYSGTVDSAYESVLGREADAEGAAYWASQLESGAVTQQNLEDHMRNAAMAAGEVPQFANGGMHAGGLRMVGERGPEIEATGSSRIMSNSDLMQSLGASTEMLNELRSMRADLKAANRALVKSNEKQRELLQRWDQAGLPEERTFV